MSHPARQPRAFAAFLLVAAVLFGAVLGLALDRLVLLPRAGYAGETPAAPPTARPDTASGARPGGGVEWMGPRPNGRTTPERYLRHLERELALSPDQSARLESILEDQQAKVMEITRETRPQLRAVAEETRAAIRQVLTPEQWERFQEMRQRRDRFHEGHGGPPADTGRRSPR